MARGARRARVRVPRLRVRAGAPRRDAGERGVAPAHRAGRRHRHRPGAHGQRRHGAARHAGDRRRRGGGLIAGRRDVGRLPLPALAAAGVVLLAYGAPVLATGTATFAGYIKLDDTATWLGSSITSSARARPRLPGAVDLRDRAGLQPAGRLSARGIRGPRRAARAAERGRRLAVSALRGLRRRDARDGAVRADGGRNPGHGAAGAHRRRRGPAGDALRLRAVGRHQGDRDRRAARARRRARGTPARRRGRAPGGPAARDLRVRGAGDAQRRRRRVGGAPRPAGGPARPAAGAAGAVARGALGARGRAARARGGGARSP